MWKQFVGLFVTSLLIWTVGNGLFPMLPLQAIRFGTRKEAIGGLLAVIFLALCIGSLTARHLTIFFRSAQWAFVAAICVLVMALIGIGQSGNIVLFFLSAIIAWFCFGTVICLIRIATAQQIHETTRGKAFGALSTTVGLGSFLGGLLTGWIDDRYGFSILLFICAILLILAVPVALYFRCFCSGLSEASTTLRKTSRLLPSVVVNFAVINGIICFAGFAARLGTPLEMQDLGFSSLPITSTVAIGGVLSIPVALLLGFLSDRYGRTTLLFSSYLALTAGVFILTFAKSIEHFFVSACLVSLYFYAGSGLASAFLADVLVGTDVSSGVSLFDGTYWLGGVFGFGLTGYAYQHAGKLATFIVLGCIALVGTITAFIIFSSVNSHRVHSESSSC